MGSSAIPLRPAWHRSQGLVPRPDRGQALPAGPGAACVVTASILSVKRGACGGQGVRGRGGSAPPAGSCIPLGRRNPLDALTEMPQEEGDLSGARGGDLGHSLRGGAMRAEPWHSCKSDR